MPDPHPPLRSIAIVGTGLIGASFALALRKGGFGGNIVGVDERPYAVAALHAQAIDEIRTLDEVAEKCDLLYLSGTVDNIQASIQKLGTLIRPGCLITDVGSTKQAIVNCAASYLPTDQFVGGHPMAGKEKRGAEHADADLFRGRPYILTSRSSLPVYSEFLHWLERIGARLVELDAHQHDLTVAYSSHLPQLLATALACNLAQHKELPITSVFGTGLTDMTRLALSAPGLWTSILETNREQVAAALDSYLETLTRIRQDLSAGQLREVFQVANEYAYLLRSRS